MLRLVCLLVLVCITSCNLVTVKTRQGKITGTTSPKVPNVTKFLGIRYGATKERFEKGSLAGSWNEVLDATRYGPACYQARLNDKLQQSEDCLRLNIFTTTKFTNGVTSSSDKPVMVYIHGGGYKSGTSVGVDGSQLSLTGDVVVVTVEYRLGLFGFLYTKGISPTNLGLWDQRLALQWIKANIQDFGGNKSLITLFGSSAGSASISHHMRSPYNNGKMFQRAILQSGATATLDSPILPDPQQLIKTVAAEASCKTNVSTDEIMKCLKQTSSQVMAETYRNLISRGKTPFYAMVDGDYITHSWLEVISKYNDKGVSSIKNLVGNLADYDLVSGYNSQEGITFSKITKDMLTNGITAQQFKEMSRRLDRLYSYSSEKQLATHLSDMRSKTYYSNKYLYHKNFSFKQNNLWRLVQYKGDTEFAIPAITDAVIHQAVAPNRKTYIYEFDHYPPKSNKQSWLKTGGAHGELNRYVFGKEKRNQTEQNLSTDIKKHWTSFARFGDPKFSPSKTTRTVETWKPFSTTTQNYLKITVNKDTAMLNPKEAETKLLWCIWSAVFYSKDESACDTTPDNVIG